MNFFFYHAICYLLCSSFTCSIFHLLIFYLLNFCVFVSFIALFYFLLLFCSIYYFGCYILSLVAQMVKNLPTMWETWVQSLGWEDSLEEGMETHFSILAWRIPMDRGAWWATVHRITKSQTGLSD